MHCLSSSWPFSLDVNNSAPNRNVFATVGICFRGWSQPGPQPRGENGQLSPEIFKNMFIY